MSWFWKSINSSIGKKLVMAITGICLILFLKIHLFNNLTLFAGPDVFNAVVKSLDSIKPLIRVIEVILATIFILHILNGFRLYLENRKARPVEYTISGASKNSTVFSRTMIHSGSIILIFLVVHLRTMWVSFNFDAQIHENHTYYETVSAAFQSPIYAGFYILAMFVLGFHLNHGFQSAFQTFGWNNNKYFPIIKIIGTVYSVLVALLFASIPVYFLFFFGGN